MSFEPSIKQKIVKEAANLLYIGIEKEYKQAKIKAAKIFGSKTFPTNHAIALELDRISEEREGTERQRNLIKMRRDALKIMKVLSKFNPILIGSVWRGTSNHNSDIDVLVYYEDPIKIENIIEKQGYLIFQSKRVSVTKKGINKSAYHIYVKNSNNQIIEIVINNADEQFIVKKCEIFGDKITGLDIKNLEKMLEENPAQKFIPI